MNTPQNTQNTPTTQHPILIQPTTPPEDDFSELDAILAAAPAYRRPNDRQKDMLRAFQQALQHPLESAEQFQLQEGVVVWQQIECRCGWKSPLLFVRMMELWTKSEGKLINWKTVEEFSEGLEISNIKDTLISRKSCWCEKCAPVSGELVKFNEYVKGE